MQKKRISSIIIYLVGVVVLTFIDQITKVMAVDALKGKAPFEIISGVFEFYYLENKGAAWGVMSGARIFFLVLTVVIVALIIYVSAKMPHNNMTTTMTAAIILPAPDFFFLLIIASCKKGENQGMISACF